MNLTIRILFLFLISASFATLTQAEVNSNCVRSLLPEVISPVVPKFSTSFAERHPNVLRKLDHLEAEFHGEVLEMPRRKSSLTPKELEIKFVEVSKRFEDAFQEIRGMGAGDAKFEGVMDQSIANLRLKDSSLNRLRRKIEKHTITQFEADEIVYNLYTKLLGDIAEVRFALQVPEYIARGKHLPDVVAMFSSEERRALALNYLKDNQINGEIDVIFKSDSGKIVWCEAKNYQNYLKASAQARTLLQQLTKITELRNKVDPNIEIHLYVLHGMTKGMRAKFENIGVYVY
ncbi:MAG: hypothetical protein HYW49_09160 [Deltaproteobacteria bacterium]|nr:hypothetical protein [Deltaproteobacteria bacterium]